MTFPDPTIPTIIRFLAGHLNGLDLAFSIDAGPPGQLGMN